MRPKLSPYLFDQFPQLAALYLEAWEQVKKHGKYKNWATAMTSISDLKPDSVELNMPAIQIGSASDITEAERVSLYEALQTFKHWRKGPFHFFGIDIDTEWRSDLKWDRLKNAITPLSDRTVLDIGCGSGYHLWRMLGAGASHVLGIDPSALFAMQFQMTQKFIQSDRIDFIPIGLEALPEENLQWDTIFSMGILYHRRSPLDHLSTIRKLLNKDGELILETLVIEGDASTCLMPEDRYACMRNVWFIPSVDMLCVWLNRSGFGDVALIDVARTTTEEQRKTDWIESHSLADFLDPDDPGKTLEGYPAPRRAILRARI